MRQRLPKAFYNPISLIGAVIAVFNTDFIVFLSVIEAFSRRVHPYADLVIWLILPALILLGVVLIVIGIWRERRKERAGTKAMPRCTCGDSLRCELVIQTTIERGGAHETVYF